MKQHRRLKSAYKDREASGSRSHHRQSMLKIGSAVATSENPNLSRLFEKIYCSNRRVNATAIDIDSIVDERRPTFTEEELMELFLARSADLGVPPLPTMQARFLDVARKLCLNRKVTFTEMNLGSHFATELASLLQRGPHRFCKLDLRKNVLSDTGVKILMQQIARSKSIAYLNLASNELTNEGMTAIFEGLRENQSVVSLDVSTIEGVARNRVSAGAIEALKVLLEEN